MTNEEIIIKGKHALTCATHFESLTCPEYETMERDILVEELTDAYSELAGAYKELYDTRNQLAWLAEAGLTC